MPLQCLSLAFLAMPLGARIKPLIYAFLASICQFDVIRRLAQPISPLTFLFMKENELCAPYSL